MARTRGHMKHPYRIRVSKGRKRDTIPDVDLDIGIGDQQPKKAVNVAVMAPKQHRTGYNRQQEQNIQRLIEEKKREDELKKQQEQVTEKVVDIGTVTRKWTTRFRKSP